ncbi:MAG: ADP-ribosyl-(dinitrogen reductase) hydrolase [Halieaceae bacterium]|nr:ADP-ribosyl-(dinitrogen reductase) hydrolase [Halieaceae bacterium]
MARTSQSHPLQVNALTPSGGGRIGITFCPGKKQLNAATGDWDRDLQTDLEAIKAWGADLIINLIEDHEMAQLQVENTAALLPPKIEYLRLPISDFSIPGENWEISWDRLSLPVAERLRRGASIVVHCKGGLGRAGLCAARLLVELGCAPSDAIQRIRAERPGALETPEQEGYIKTIGESVRRARLVGCLLGGAVGDALGGAVEFQTHEAIISRYGEPGIVDYVMAYGGTGKITDDTQMTLFTAEGLMLGRQNMNTFDRGALIRTVALAYLRWGETQGQHNPLLKEPDRAAGRLIHQDDLHNRRAPGNTCLSALTAMKVLGQQADNNSKGCGGVMRVAPVGLFMDTVQPTLDLQGTFDLSCDLAGITHGHPSGRLPAGVLAVVVQLSTRGMGLRESLAQAMTVLVEKEHHEETTTVLERAIALSMQDVCPIDAIEMLGEGWIAEEALAIAVYCCLKAHTFEEAIVIAVNHGGDSDSTGAIAGNILGASQGFGVIPERWLESLELKQTIENSALMLV